MRRKLFTEYPIILSDAMMWTTEFWQWLKRQDDCDTLSQVLQNYLGSKGFDLKLHYLTSRQIDTHQIVYDHFRFLKDRGLEV